MHKKGEKIYITNHHRMPGKAFASILKGRCFKNIILKPPSALNLLDRKSVMRFFLRERPSIVILTSVRSGGIQANIDHPAEFLYENLQSDSNVIYASSRLNVKKLLYVGASCVYPKESPSPIKEPYLLTGALEPTSRPYSIAKIAGIELCKAYRMQYGAPFFSVIPATIYGSGDDFSCKASHVIPGLIRRFREAKLCKARSVTVWGSGKARREFIYEEDFVDACFYVMWCYRGIEPINIGVRRDISIRQLAVLIKEVVDFKGALRFDVTKPEGSPCKLLDSSVLWALGWKPKMDLKAGIKRMYEAYLRS